jgi:hypothetical protein
LFWFKPLKYDEMTPEQKTMIDHLLTGEPEGRMGRSTSCCAVLRWVISANNSVAQCVSGQRQSKARIPSLYTLENESLHLCEIGHLRSAPGTVADVENDPDCGRPVRRNAMDNREQVRQKSIASSVDAKLRDMKARSVRRPVAPAI